MLIYAFIGDASCTVMRYEELWASSSAAHVVLMNHGRCLTFYGHPLNSLSGKRLVVL